MSTPKLPPLPPCPQCHQAIEEILGTSASAAGIYIVLRCPKCAHTWNVSRAKADDT